jgi:hypothetical protein
MHYTVQKLPNEPITVWTPTDEWDWVADVPQANAELIAIWDKSTEPIYHIVNTQTYRFDLDAMMSGAAAVAFGENALYTHPNLKTAIILTQDPKVLYGLNAMLGSMKSGSGVYKSVPMFVMSSQEEALAYIRKERAAK